MGNSILERIDPLEWKLSNPWDQISFEVGFYLSKRGLAHIRKTAPAPAVEEVAHIHHRGITHQKGWNHSRVSHINWDINKYIKGA